MYNVAAPPRYAFITYGTKEEADQAKQMMNGTTVCGQEIKVAMMMIMMTMTMMMMMIKNMITFTGGHCPPKGCWKPKRRR